jgi:asparagine synthase (glutamine-hydrolysing)
MKKIDEPLYDSSILPTFFVSSVAAQDVKVVLSGEGGDELFAGYTRHLVMSQMSKGNKELSLLERVYLEMPEFKGKKKFFSHLFKNFQDYYAYYLFDQSLSTESSGWEQVKKKYYQNNFDWLSLDRLWYLQSDLLRKIDLGTSYASIEGRVPFLDQRLVSVVRGRQKQWLLKNAELKFQEKEILRTYLPNELVQRGKSGFGLDLKSYFERLPVLDEHWNLAVKRLDEIDVVRDARKYVGPSPLRFQKRYLDIVIDNVLQNCGYYE